MPSLAPDTTEWRPFALSGYLRVAPYTDPINAVAMRKDLHTHAIGPVEIRINDNKNPPVHRVVIGPFDDEAAAADMRSRLTQRSLKAEWINE